MRQRFLQFNRGELLAAGLAGVLIGVLTGLVDDSIDHQPQRFITPTVSATIAFAVILVLSKYFNYLWNLYA